jgi:hypothetical protein
MECIISGGTAFLALFYEADCDLAVFYLHDGGVLRERLNIGL